MELLEKIPEAAVQKLPMEKLIELAKNKGYNFEGYDDETLSFFNKEDIAEMIRDQYEERIKLRGQISGEVPAKLSQSKTRKEKNKQKKKLEIDRTLGETEEETLERLKEDDAGGMNFVEPIRDKQKIEEIKEYLKQKNMRNYMYFLIGINTALRVSDLRMLRAYDFIKHDYKKIVVDEQKTGKEKTMFLNPSVAEEIKRYIESNELSETDFLFPSRKKKDGKKVPISRVQAYNIVHDFIKAVGLEGTGDYGTHTLRKTWAYMYYTHKEKDVAYLMTKLNHSSQQITLRYIGITDKVEEENAKEFKL